MPDAEPAVDEISYDTVRLAQWRAGVAAGHRFTRRDLARLSAGVVLGAGAAGPAAGGTAAAAAVAADPPILKPLPPELFTIHGTNAEMRWDAMAGQGYRVPVERFFVRNHTRTPRIDAATWQLRLHGSGLHDGAAQFSYAELRAMPRTTLTAFVECAGNARSLFASQQGQSPSGTAWGTGAVGVASWTGVRLREVLRRAGTTPDAVDVQPEGLDPDFVTGGVNLGPVRRPLPMHKAMDDVLLAYEMNGEQLTPDHGYPVRVVVPGWIGIASIKWVGRIEVSAQPLFSPWNTQFYRLFGPGYPADGQLINRQVVKSAFELAWGATLAGGTSHRIRGRAWSGNGAIRCVEVSADGGATWLPARLTGPEHRRGWRQWEFRWRPDAAGEYTLRARATDETGASQPAVTPFNTLGYLFGASIAHPVTVV